MTTRYLIGRAELLTYPIEAPKKKVGDKAHPYTLTEAKRIIVPEIETANRIFQELPAKACADDLAVARLVLHPAYLAKSYFPKLLLDQVGLSSVGSRTRRIQPRRQTQKKAPPEMETTELFVSGTRAAMGNFPAFARSLNEQMPVAEQFARIETFAAMTPADRLHLEGANVGHVFEVGLHLPPRAMPRMSAPCLPTTPRTAASGSMASSNLKPAACSSWQSGCAGLENLAQFTLTRVVRPMPHLRAARPVTRSMPLAVSFSLPSGEPLSREPKVAILDGGLPEKHVLESYVRRYFLADEDASDVPDFTSTDWASPRPCCLGRLSRKQRRSAPMRRSIIIVSWTPRLTGKIPTSCIARSAMSKPYCSRASTSSSISAWDRTCRSRPGCPCLDGRHRQHPERWRNPDDRRRRQQRGTRCRPRP
jgi:hypothetical protein